METQYKSTRSNSARLEDSHSLQENQKRFPEDPFVEAENRRLAEKWHEKMAACRKMEEKLEIKYC
jgi:hypothetical protein